MSARAATPQERAPLVEVRELVKHYRIRSGLLRRTQGWIPAVDGVSLSIAGGETLGLVGESGSGKSTLGRAILRLIEPTSGTVRFEGVDLGGLDPNSLRAARRSMQIIFQDPYSTLDPRKTAAESIAEGLRIHDLGSRADQQAQVHSLLERVGLERALGKRLPAELSGGQRQRVGIARALALRPKFIVADEPVSALDMPIQRQVLGLLSDLQSELGLTYLFIAHNLQVVQQVADRVAVMYLGKIVELAPTQELLNSPLHPYTQALLAAVPRPEPGAGQAQILLKGEVASQLNPPSGCRFHPRCLECMHPICPEQAPEWIEHSPGHWVACWLHTAG